MIRILLRSCILVRPAMAGDMKMSIGDPTALCSDVFNKAYVLTQTDVLHFYEVGKRWVDVPGNAAPRLTCKASLKNTHERLMSDTADAIVQYSNPKKQQIEGLSLAMVSSDRERTFELVFRSQEYPALIQLEIGGPHTEEAERLFRTTSAEISDLAQWYSRLACRRWLTRLLSWIGWLLLILIVAVWFLSVVGSLYRYHRHRKEVAEFQRRHPVLLTDALKQVEQNEKTPASKKERSPSAERERAAKTTDSHVGVKDALYVIWQLVSSGQFLLGMGIVIGGAATERLTWYLFPRSVFEIGNGAVRHQRLKAIRKWLAGLIGTIILLGFIIPWVQRLL